MIIIKRIFGFNYLTPNKVNQAMKQEKIRTLCLFTTVIFISTSISAQVAMIESQMKPVEQAAPNAQVKAESPKIIQEEEIVYVDNESKIFVNKNLPIYLKFSTSPDGKTHDLKSLKHPEDAEPLYLDTEGPNYIRTKWAVDPETKEYMYPLREVQMELFADSKPPVVSPVFNSEHSFTKSGVIYYGSDLDITLKDWDEQAGVKGSYWSINNSQWKNGKTTFVDQNSGDYSFTYYSVDNVNNYTDPKTVTFAYDNRAPETSLLKTKEGSYIFGPRTPVQFSVVEEHSGVKATYFRLSDLAFAMAKSGQSLPLSLEDGEYPIVFYSVDNVSNDEEPKEVEIYLDKIAPQTSLQVTPSFEKGQRLYLSQSSEIALSATDNKAGVKNINFSTTGFKDADYQESFSINNFHGLTSISYEATDVVDNREKRKYQEIYVDTLRPSSKIAFIGKYFEVASRYYVNEETRLEFQASDLNSGVAYIEYAAIGNDFEKYEKPFGLSSEGYFGLMYRSIDNVENMEYSKSIDLYLDKKGPEIVFNFSNQPISEGEGVTVYPAGTRLFLGATDDMSGTNTISYQINDQKEVHYSSPKTIDISERKAFRKGQEYSVQITTTDLVDNESTKTITFRIEE